MNKNMLIVAAVVLVLVIAVAAWWFGSAKKVSETAAGIPAEQAAPASDSSFGGTVAGKLAPGNPASQIPETSPLTTSVNPYAGGAYTNPFGK